MVCGHKLDGGFSESGVVLVELSSELSYWFCGIEQSSCGVCSESDDDFGVYDFDLLLEVGEAICNFIWFWVAVFRWSAFQDISDIDVFFFQS